MMKSKLMTLLAMLMLVLPVRALDFSGVWIAHTLIDDADESAGFALFILDFDDMEGRHFGCGFVVNVPLDEGATASLTAGGDWKCDLTVDENVPSLRLQVKTDTFRPDEIDVEIEGVADKEERETQARLLKMMMRDKLNESLAGMANGFADVTYKIKEYGGGVLTLVDNNGDETTFVHMDTGD